MTGMEVTNLSLATGGALRVEQVNAHVTPGHLIAIVGANGSGKSSLLSLMAGHLQPRSGQVLLAGQPIGSLAPAERARHLAWLGQSTPWRRDIRGPRRSCLGCLLASQKPTRYPPRAGRGD